MLVFTLFILAWIAWWFPWYLDDTGREPHYFAYWLTGLAFSIAGLLVTLRTY